MDIPLTNLSYALIAAFTIPSVIRLAKSSLRAKTTNDGLYEDKDGRATEESVAQYWTSRPFIFVFVAIALALVTSLALACFATVRRDHSFSDQCLVRLWLLFAAWVKHPTPFICKTY